MRTSFWESPVSFPLRLFGFVGWFLWQFVVTSLKVVSLILIPGRKPSPGIVRMSIGDLSETEVTILVLLITITPDTLVIAVNRDQGSMYVHGMFVAGDAESFRSSLKITHDRMLHGIRFRPNFDKRGVAA
jgi:multicomponent Na+:H+ antiporter subunit E